jgi:hypothetical protein
MYGWTFAHLLYFLAIIAFIIGILIAVGVGSKQGDDFTDNDKQNVNRAFFFFFFALVAGVLALFQQNWDYHC